MKKYLNLYALRAVELLLSVFITATLFLGDFNDDIGLTLPTGLRYLPLVAGILIIVLFALEFFKSKPWVRLVYLLLSFLICLMMCETLELFNMTVWLFGFFYMFFAIVALFRTRSAIARSKEVSEKTLPMGFVRKKDFVFLCVALGLFAFLIVIDLLLSDMYAISKWYSLPALLVVGCVLVFIYCFYVFGGKGFGLRYVNYQLSFKKFDEHITETLKNNLDPETANYLRLLRSNYMFAYDKQEGIRQFEEVKRPAAKIYIPVYDMLKVLYYVNKGNFEQAGEELKFYKLKYPRSEKSIKMLDLMFTVYTTREVVDDIERAVDMNSKIPFARLSNIYELMIYYSTRGQNERAQEYARLILEKDTDFQEWNGDARKVLDGEEVDTVDPTVANGGNENEVTDQAEGGNENELFDQAEGGNEAEVTDGDTE